MKKYEIVGMDEATLKTSVVSAKKKIDTIRFDSAVEPSQNPMVIRGLKRDIARMLTRLSKLRREKSR